MPFRASCCISVRIAKSPTEPVFMRICWFYRVATLTGLSLLKAGLYNSGLRLGCCANAQGSRTESSHPVRSLLLAKRP